MSLALHGPSGITPLVVVGTTQDHDEELLVTEDGDAVAMHECVKLPNICL
jgi:hypothetical protein